MDLKVLFLIIVVVNVINTLWRWKHEEKEGEDGDS